MPPSSTSKRPRTDSSSSCSSSSFVHGDDQQQQQPASSSSYRLRHIVKENHGTPITTLVVIPSTTTASSLAAEQDCLVLSVADQQANVYRSKHLDIASHLVNEATEFSKGGQITTACWIEHITRPNEAVFVLGAWDGCKSVVSLARSRIEALLKHDDDDDASSTVCMTTIGGTNVGKEMIASLSGNGMVSLWDTRSQSRLGVLTSSSSSNASCIRARPGQDEIYVSNSRTNVLEIFAVVNNTLVASGGKVIDTMLPKGGISSFSFLGPDRILLHSSGDQCVYVLDIVTQGSKPTRVLKAGMKSTCICVSHDGLFACLGDKHGDIHVIDFTQPIPSNGTSLSFAKLKSAITCVSFGCSEKTVFCGTQDGVVVKWSM